VIVYEHGNTRYTWKNVPLHWRQNGKFSLEIVARFQTTHLHEQHEHISVDVAVVRKAALAVLFDDGLERWENYSDRDHIMGTNANLSWDEPSLNSSYPVSTRALEQINVLLVSSAEQRTEDALAPLTTKRGNIWQMRKRHRRDKMDFDFLEVLTKELLQPDFFDDLTEG
jgi:hypothetical protein